MDARFLTYVLVAAVLIVTPGPDMALVARNAVRGGYPAARATAFGVGAGIFLWGCGTAAGLAQALAASAAVFSALKLAGALFLVALGVRSLLRARRAADAAALERPAVPLRGRPAFVQGLIGNLLNPKAGAIFVAVVPQFVEPGDPATRLAAMTAAFVVMVTVWLNVYGFAIARAFARFGTGMRRLLDGIAGAVMIGLGVRLAVARR
ncbi:MAG TPA: LysE family translocator [bacterium]|nr:LysE family translocator [bacterium]